MTDYIPREAAFNAVLKLVPKVDDDGYCWVIRGDAATAIDSIPAADVRPVVRGRWEKCRGGDMCICSACYKYYIAVDEQYDFNFCPNCGAYMKGDN